MVIRTASLIAVLSILLFATFSVAAQNWDEDSPASPDTDSAFSAEMEKDLAEFYGEQASDFGEFKDERDREFAEFLREQWLDFQEYEGLIRDNVPKPKTIPRASDRPDETTLVPAGKKIVPQPPAPRPVVVVNPPPTKPAPRPVDKPALPVPAPLPAPAPAPAPSQPEATPVAIPVRPVVTLAFYGQELHFDYDKKRLPAFPAEISNQAIGNYWEEISQTEFSSLIEQLQWYRNELRLNDWGYYQLVQAFSTRVSSGRNDDTLLSWFLLVKSGFRARVGYSDDQVILLIPSRNTIYKAPFYKLDEEKYYNFSFLRDQQKPGTIKTYQREYPGAELKVGFDLYATPAVMPDTKTTGLSFRYLNQTYEIPASYNRNLIRYYQDYPSTDMHVFFSAAVAPEVESSLIEGLTPIIKGKTETEAVNILLRFVQTAFAYKTDGDQFGQEKYMFAAETIYFPYSDCEDRAILFGYLVKKLVNLDVVGLIYPGHAATAVRFTEPVEGDQVMIDGNAYLVCDPTYINANIGVAMPQFQQVTPEVVRIDFHRNRT